MTSEIPEEAKDAAAKMYRASIDYDDNSGDPDRAGDFWRIFEEARDEYKRIIDSISEREKG